MNRPNIVDTRTSNRQRRVWTALALAWCLVPAAYGAVLTEETFDSGAAGWSDRDGNMTFSSGSGFIQGSFAANNPPLTDAFRVTTGDFIGDYLAVGAQSWIFSFTALSVAPSDLSVRLFGDGEFFFTTLTPVAGTFTYQVSLAYSGAWLGTGGATEFDLALQDVTAVEIQFTMSGTGAQSYRLNSFELSGDEFGGSGAIPEPGSSLFIVGALILFTLRGRKKMTGGSAPLAA